MSILGCNVTILYIIKFFLASAFALLIVTVGGIYYFNQNDVNENKPEYIKQDILNVAEITATMTVRDFDLLVDVSDTDFLNETFGRNQNLMHAAVANDDSPQMVQKLIDVGVDMNHQDDDLRTPLHHAIDADKYVAAQILIENGADVTLENGAGLNPPAFCELVLGEFSNHKTCTYVIENTGI